MCVKLGVFKQYDNNSIMYKTYEKINKQKCLVFTLLLIPDKETAVILLLNKAFLLTECLLQNK